MNPLHAEVCLPVRSARPVRENIRPFFDQTIDHQVSISTYARIVWNRRWAAIPVALGVFLIILFATIKQKPVFRSSGTLEIDMPKEAVTGVTGLFQNQVASENYLQTQAEILRSHAFATKLVGKMAPLNITDAPHGDSGPASIDSTVHGLSVEVLPGSRLIKINDESTSPETAARIVNTLMALYIEKAGQQRTESVQNASSWLLNQLNETRAKLEQATQSLQQYEVAHQILFVESKNGVSQSLESERLEQLQTNLIRAQELRIEKDSLNKRALAGDVTVLRDPLLDDLQTKETVLEQKLSQVSVKFGPNFPEVKQATAQLQDLRSNEDVERARAVQMSALDLEAAVRQENLMRAALDHQQKLVNGDTQQLLQDGILKRDVELDKQLYEGLLRQMNEAENFIEAGRAQQPRCGIGAGPGSKHSSACRIQLNSWRVRRTESGNRICFFPGTYPGYVSNRRRTPNAFASPTFGRRPRGANSQPHRPSLEFQHAEYCSAHRSRRSFRERRSRKLVSTRSRRRELF